MSYQEKKTIVSMITGIAVLAAYCVYAFGQYNSGAAAADDWKFWAVTMLKFIGIGVLAAIVIQIIFHILLSISIAVQQKIRDESTDDAVIGKSIDAEMVEDEMDKLIELKSMRISFALAGIGFVTGLIALAVGLSPMVMLNIVFLSIGVGSLLEGFSQLYFYRRGI